MKMKKIKIGVDLGGSKIRIALWDGERVVERWRTEQVSLAKMKQGLGFFAKLPTAIAVAGLVERKTGRILDCPNLKGFQGKNLKKLFGSYVQVDNDVNCFLRAESRLGAGVGQTRVLAVMMGTGIGGAIKTGKDTEEGAHGLAGEFGRMILSQGKTWEKLYQLNKNNPQKQQEIHALAIANLIHIFDPAVIVIGGGAAFAPKKAALNKYLSKPFQGKTKLALSKIGQDAVAVGAALSL